MLVIGSYLSPYVRKVLVCLELKGLEYEVDPIIPFYGDDSFTKLSPMRRVPVLMQAETTLADSSVICEYLDDRYPGTPLYPRTPIERAQARWLEEYADTQLGDVLIWRLYDQRVIRRFVWHLPADEAIVNRSIEQEIPQVLDYLEQVLPQQGWIFGALSMADISIAAFFRNASIAGYEIDTARWPATAAFVTRVQGEPPFVTLRRFEDISLRTPISGHRDALRDAGAPVSAATIGTDSPRRARLNE